jgi:DNA-directed RNA polymerase subunit RPC12/RpoP
MGYGGYKWVDYRCGKCGTYLIETQTHHGTRGGHRCNKCNQQVRENPRVTKVLHPEEASGISEHG